MIDPNTGLETVTAEPPVKFDEKQQAMVNRLIQTKQGEAAAAVRAELATTVAAKAQLEADLAVAKADLAKAKTPGDKKDSKGDVDALTAQLEEVKTIAAQTRLEAESYKQRVAQAETRVKEQSDRADNIQKQVAIGNAAARCNFVDSSVVAKLTAENVKFDTVRGAFVVIGENGQERMNSSFGAMTLDEYYAEFATKNPYLVRSDARSGVGSSESQKSALSTNGKYTVEQIFGKNSSSLMANRLSKENHPEYMRLRGLAKEAGLI